MYNILKKAINNVAKEKYEWYNICVKVLKNKGKESIFIDLNYSTKIY